jgi:hypothetical protein
VGTKVGLESGLREEEKILDPTTTQTPDSLVVQPVANHYTECAIPAPQYVMYTCQIFVTETNLLQLYFREKTGMINIFRAVPNSSYHCFLLKTVVST